VQIEFDALKYQNITMKVFDILGNEMHLENLKCNAGLNSIQINLSEYANGAYFIQLSSENKELYYGKVLKQ